MRRTVLVSHAMSPLGVAVTRRLAESGHAVYAGDLDIDGVNAAPAAAARRYAAQKSFLLRPVELDPHSQRSVTCAVATIIKEQRRIDVMVHNGLWPVADPDHRPTPGYTDKVHHANLLGAQRLNRAVVPQMRRQGEGLLVYLGGAGYDGESSVSAATKVAADSLAAVHAAKVARLGIDTTIIPERLIAKGTVNDSALAAAVAALVLAPPGRSLFLAQID
ncbi:SDR family NAD(P)-dependent oxidoreductase [Kribbella sp. NPDC051587]|uniref:SDR family NAD(P)-dependent oxidoreductase n=1 Tax=Kribbella sp. NPDC051587 TaxID=3364119 RepID=UPI0037BB2094